MRLRDSLDSFEYAYSADFVKNRRELTVACAVASVGSDGVQLARSRSGDYVSFGVYASDASCIKVK
jgi:hypothetical protein